MAYRNLMLSILSIIPITSLAFACSQKKDIEVPATSSDDRTEIVIMVDSITEGKTKTEQAASVIDTIQIPVDGDGLDMYVTWEPYSLADDQLTRTTSIESIPSSLYLERTTGKWKSETVKNTSSAKTVLSGKISTGWYMPGTATAYNYYVSNQPISFASQGSTISASNTSDIIAGCTNEETCSVTPYVTLDHVFSRTGSLILNSPNGYSVSDVNWSLSSIEGGTAGTYNIATKRWSDVTALPSTPVTSSSDLYLIPGDYAVQVSYTLNRGSWSGKFTRTGYPFTMAAGRIYSLSATADIGKTLTGIYAVSNSFQMQVGDYYQEALKIEAVYSDGSTEDITANAAIESDERDWKAWIDLDLCQGGYDIKATDAGEGIITFSYTYKGVKAYCDVDWKVIPKSAAYTYRLSITPSTKTIYVGSTASLTAILSTYSGNTMISSNDVTKNCTWSCNDNTVAAVSKGTVTALKTGATTITAIYNADDGSAATSSSVVTVITPSQGKRTVTSISGIWTIFGISYGGGFRTRTTSTYDGDSVSATCVPGGTLIEFLFETNDMKETKFSVIENITCTLSDGSTMTVSDRTYTYQVQSEDSYLQERTITGTNVETTSFYIGWYADSFD